ncbi:hypothetical protein [Winogradskyella poriferorum]|uniref:hypothetical protein n=1 Tax=Winogradskyella poriferorum TaxID=307627 RepID=UPI003D64A093
MEKIEYPMIRVNSSTWIDYEELFPLFNGYMYATKDEVFKSYFFNKEFVDSKGNTFKVVDRIPTTNFFRKLFKFLPGVYREKLVFKRINKKLKLESFKEDIIRGIKKFDSDATKKISESWIDQIKKSNTFGEVINGKAKKLE